MYGVFLTRSLNAVTMAFGTHVTSVAREALRLYPALDYVLRGEPEMTLRELIDTHEVAAGRRQAAVGPPRQNIPDDWRRSIEQHVGL